jgi:hypothetical protein
MIPGYAVRELTLRTDGADRYWVLVAKAYESGFVTQK